MMPSVNGAALSVMELAPDIALAEIYLQSSIDTVIEDLL